MLKWLDGKKTVIGAVALLLSMIGREVIIGIWGLEHVYLTNTILTLDWIGGVVTTIGLGHKYVKSNGNTGRLPQ